MNNKKTGGWKLNKLEMKYLNKYIFYSICTHVSKGFPLCLAFFFHLSRTDGVREKEANIERREEGTRGFVVLLLNEVENTIALFWVW